MKILDQLRVSLHRLPPELAHGFAIAALSTGLLPAQYMPQYSALSQSLWGLKFPNPVGMAAGFDKNAEAIDGLLAQGFGFVEVGTVTPKPQPGNAKPRLFRLSEDGAIINRMGMNNVGADDFVKNLQKRKRRGVVGANIGRNKDSEDAVSDYVTLMQKVYGAADYITVNISSPNTEGLRKLQDKQKLKELLVALTHARIALQQGHGMRKPLLVKIAPDLDDAQKADIAETALAYQVDGLIVTNTTVSRPETLKSSSKTQQGGLSGKPLFAMATQTLRDMYKLTEGRITLIGVGGISSGEDAWAKIVAGASLVQVYTAVIYQGFGLINSINRYLAERMAKEGIKDLSEIIGAEHR